MQCPQTLVTLALDSLKLPPLGFSLYKEDLCRHYPMSCLPKREVRMGPQTATRLATKFLGKITWILKFEGLKPAGIYYGAISVLVMSGFCTVVLY